MAVFELPNLEEAEKRLDDYFYKKLQSSEPIQDWVAVKFALKKLKKETVVFCDYLYIHQWMRDPENKIFGVMVAVKLDTNNSICIGWSKLHDKDTKPFDKSLGMKIAIDRALKGSKVRIRDAKRDLGAGICEVHYEVCSARLQYKKFIDRAHRYFKGCPLGSIAGDSKIIEDIMGLVQTWPTYIEENEKPSTENSFKEEDELPWEKGEKNATT